MAKKIVRTAGAAIAAGAVLLGSTVPANAFAQIPAAADLSYDYTNYEFDYTSYTTPATTYVAPQAQAQQAYTAPQAETQQAPVAPVATQEQAAPVASSGNASRDAIVATAMSGLGGSYVWGGKSYGAWDCSGFTSWVFAQHGIKLTAYTYAMKDELPPARRHRLPERLQPRWYLPGRRQDDLRSEPHQRYPGAPHLLDVR